MFFHSTLLILDLEKTFLPHEISSIIQSQPHHLGLLNLSRLHYAENITENYMCASEWLQRCVHHQASPTTVPAPPFILLSIAAMDLTQPHDLTVLMQAALNHSLLPVCWRAGLPLPFLMKLCISLFFVLRRQAKLADG